MSAQKPRLHTAWVSLSRWLNLVLKTYLACVPIVYRTCPDGSGLHCTLVLIGHFLRPSSLLWLRVTITTREGT